MAEATPPPTIPPWVEESLDFVKNWGQEIAYRAEGSYFSYTPATPIITRLTVSS